MAKDGGYWANDAETDNCAGCSKSFSMSVWKHHCNKCGEIFCSECSDKKKPIPERGHKGPVRVCTMCFLSKQRAEERRALLSAKNVNAFMSEAELALRESNQEAMDSLLRIYKAKVKPLEQRYRFDYCYSPLNDGDFEPRPMVLLLGQYSVGKTTFIRTLLGRDFPGIRIGPEPTTDGFQAITYGPTDRVIPGNAAAVDTKRQFVGLSNFGANFLSRFNVAETPSPMLDSLTLIDTPGVLSGEKQRVDRGYDFESVVRWFAERSDRILLLFDAHKLDISDEFRRVIDILKGNEDKVRVILNKADQVSTQQLMRVYGALMWSLGKVFSTPEVVRVYLGSFWDQPLNPKGDLMRDLFTSEREDLIEDLKGLHRSCAIRKVNEMVKRTRHVRVHSLLIDYLRNELPMFGKEGKQKKMCDDPSKYIEALQKKLVLAPGDFLTTKKIQGFLSTYKLDEFKDLNPRFIDIIDIALSRDIPRLLDSIQDKQLQSEATIQDSGTNGNPFEEAVLEDQESWVVDSASKTKYDNIFFTLNPQGNPPKVSGSAARPMLLQSGLAVDALKSIWDLVTPQGSVDQEEFALLMFLINSARQNGVGSLPSKLPNSYIPPSKRVEFGKATTSSTSLFGSEPPEVQRTHPPAVSGGGSGYWDPSSSDSSQSNYSSSSSSLYPN